MLRLRTFDPFVSYVPYRQPVKVTVHAVYVAPHAAPGGADLAVCGVSVTPLMLYAIRVMCGDDCSSAYHVHGTPTSTIMQLVDEFRKMPEWTEVDGDPAWKALVQACFACCLRVLRFVVNGGACAGVCACNR